jgi:hypothetical protein
MLTGHRRHSLLYTMYAGSPVWRARRRWWWFVASDRRCARCRRRLVLHGHGRGRADVELLCWALSSRRRLVAVPDDLRPQDRAAGMPRLKSGRSRRDSTVGRWCPAGFRPRLTGRGLPRFDPLTTPSQPPAVLSAERRTVSQDSRSLSSKWCRGPRAAERRWPDRDRVVTDGRRENGAQRRADAAASSPKRQASSGRQ